jgi:hypothetical protein
MQVVYWPKNNFVQSYYDENRLPNKQKSCSGLQYGIKFSKTEGLEYDRVWRAGNDSRTLHMLEVRQFVYCGALWSNAVAT